MTANRWLMFSAWAAMLVALAHHFEQGAVAIRGEDAVPMLASRDAPIPLPIGSLGQILTSTGTAMPTYTCQTMGSSAVCSTAATTFVTTAGTR